jgi:hypothetical protein
MHVSFFHFPRAPRRLAPFCCQRLLPRRSRGSRRTLCALVVNLLALGCGSRNNSSNATIEFTTIPEAREGGPELTTNIAGRALGARPDERIVLYARSDKWWIQPDLLQVTKIQPDSTWSNSTHYGTEYAALLVEPGYRAPLTALILPALGAGVRAISVVKGRPGPTIPSKIIHFSGYDWKVRSATSNRGGGLSPYDPENAWTDPSGALHFRIAMKDGRWNCAEINMLRSLGYGTYRFVVRDISSLEPAAVLSMFSWDDNDAVQNHREFGVEISRWGDPASKNAHFVVQPYYVPANVSRFVAPSGPATYSAKWEPEKLSFLAVQGRENADHPHVIAQHVFTSGVPVPGEETVHLDFYIFQNSVSPFKKPAEVVIEKFEYLP